MNEPTEITKLEDLLQECRSLYANLSERNAQAVGGWPEMTDPISLFPGEAEETSEEKGPASSSGQEPFPGLSSFEKTFRELQRQFLVTWRGLLKANLKLESIATDRAREQSELARLSEQVMLLSQSRAEASEEKARLRQEMELLKVEAATHRESAARLEELLSLREKDLNALAAELAEKEREQHQFAEKEKALTENVKDLEKVKEHLGERLENLEKELESLRGQVEPLETELTTARNRISELESELHFTREETVPKQQLDEITETLESAVKDKAELETVVEDLRKQLQEKTTVLDERDREKTESAALLETETKKVAELKTALVERESRIRELEVAARQGLSESAIAEIENKLTTALTDLESYREQFQRMEEENKSLRKALEMANREKESSRKEPDSKVQPVDELVEIEELDDEELREREHRVADLESREIETLETQSHEISSQVLSGEVTSESVSEPTREASEEEGVAEFSVGDPSYVEEEETEAHSLSDTETNDSEETAREDDTLRVFPYPEIQADDLSELQGKRVLLVGGDIRFRQDYEHLFQLGKADLEYFPSIIQLEKKGMKNSVREANLVVAFGGATQEPGLFRLRKICTDYGRYLLEHPSSGLVSLSQKLKDALEKI